VPQDTSPVSRLFFGRDDAEHDFTDGLLRDGFLPTAAFDEASSGRKNLIIGRKGSGKSAICMWLTTAAEHAGRTCLVTPDDAAGEEIRRFELQGLTGETAKSLIWRYVFAVHAARYLVRHVKLVHGSRFAASIRALKRFLEKNGEADEERFYDRVLRGGQGLQTSLSLEAFGVVKASFDRKGGSEGARAARQLDVLESGVARAFTALRCVGQHPPLLILVDQLEQVWSSDPDSDDLVIGLLLASKQIARTYRGAVRCLLFIRSDIYDALRFDDADKFHSDEMRIAWTTDKLKDIALLRAQASLGQSLSVDELWGSVFPATVGGETAPQYLFSRTLARPRDAIQFLNQCRDAAHAAGHDTVLASDVLRATLPFSQWKLLDLAKEYRVAFPFLDRLIALFQHTGYVVMRTAVASRLAPFEEVLRTDFPKYTGVLTTDGVLGILFGVGFLGVARGLDVTYTGPGQLPIQPHETEFHIHPCFRPALNAERAAPLTPFRDPEHVANIAVQYGRIDVVDVIQGYEQTITPPRDFRLLDELTRSCERILRRLNRAKLPIDAREQVSAEISQLLSSTLRAHDSGAVDAVRHVASAADYLAGLARQLRDAGIDGTGSISVIRTLSDEAQELLAVLAGNTRRRL
jgi:hypothetical protein